MRVFFLGLGFSFFLALSAQAQSGDRLNTFSSSGSKSEGELISSFAQQQEFGQEPTQPFPLIAVSLGIVVLLCVAPFAINYFGKMSREMQDAQKNDSSSSKTTRL